MKFASFLLFFLFLASCGSQNDKSKKKSINTTERSIPPSEGEKGGGKREVSEEVQLPKETLLSKEDTIFIKRELTEGMYHAIYIEKKKNTQRFQWLTNFNFDFSDNEGYRYSKESIKEKYPKAYKTTCKTFGLSKNWVPLHKYENQYYTYAPSDWGNTGQRILNNLEFIQMYMDGPNPNPIKSSKKISDKKTEFTLFNGTKLNVCLLDKKKQIYVFEMDEGSYGKDYGFYTPASNAGNFDMIVNYCETQKQMEYDFEDVDFEALIENIK